MSRKQQTVDGAQDLLHDIMRHDAERMRLGRSQSDRSTAAVMRRIGLSDDEIVARLGYNPLGSEPIIFRETVPETHS